RPLEALEVRQGPARRRLPGGDEGLDGPGRRLGVRAAPVCQLEAAVAVSEAEQEPEPAFERSPPDVCATERLDDGRGVVRVGCAARRPAPTAGASLAGEEPVDRCTMKRRSAAAECQHAPGGAVDEAADRAVWSFQCPQARERPVDVLAK